MAYDGHLSFDTKLDTSAFSSGIGKLGGIAKSGLAVLGVSVAGAATAFAGLTKAALDSTASLEQNIGGIETLFGAGGAKSVEEYAQSVGKSVDQVQDKYNMLMEAQTKAMKDADEAYKTAGMSANDYMETITGFAAALKQSTKDEMEAAQVGNQAVIDMADNANKMGTSLESIQNAYQGFAKQNYTMLDNLKLGYGGTKEEMGRLLDDAQKLSGQKYDIGNLKDVYTAIHVIQENLGITGTTAKEAASTIEGSMNSAKAAFDNFLNGRGSAEQLADAVATATVNVAKNLGEIVPRLVATLPEVADALWDAFEDDADQAIASGADLLSGMVSGVVDQLPEIVSLGTSLLDSLIQGLNDNVPELVTSGGKLVGALIDGVLTLWSSRITLGKSIVLEIGQSIAQNAPQLRERGSEILSELVSAISTDLPVVAQQGTAALSQFVQGVLSGLPKVLESAGYIVNQLLDAVLDALPQLLEAGVDLIEQLAVGVVKNAPSALAAAISVMLQIVATIAEHLPEILQKGVELIGELAAGIIRAIPDLVAKLPEIYRAVKEELLSHNWLDIGINIAKGIAKGLFNAVGEVKSAAENVVSSAKNAVKSLLGIHSPSRVFRDEVGRNIALGISEGIRKNKKYAKKSAEEIAQAVLTAAQDRLDNHKVYNKMSLAEEVGYWEEVRKQVKDGTQARIDADKEYFDAKQKLNDQMADAEDDYTEKVAKAYQNLNDEIQSLTNQYQDAVDQRADQIKSAFGLFDEFDSETDLTSDDLLDRLQGQVDGLKEWEHNLGSLESRGIGADLLEELQGLGPKSAAQVQLLTEMTDDELNRYVDLFRQKNRIAGREAVKQMQPLRDDISKQIELLKQETASDLAEYQQEYAKAMEDLGVVLDQPAEQLKLTMAQSAVEMVAGFATAIQTESESADNTKKFQAIAENILNASSTLPEDMNSVGQNAITGMIQGLLSKEDALKATMLTIVGGAMLEAQSAVEESLFSRAVQATTPTAQRTGTPARTYGNEGNGPGTGIDYAKLGKAMSEAMNGVNVEMDGKRVGQITAEPVNDRLGDRSRMEERDMI